MKLEEVLKAENILSEFDIINIKTNEIIDRCFLDETGEIWIGGTEAEENINITDRYSLFDLVNNYKFGRIENKEI